MKKVTIITGTNREKREEKATELLKDKSFIHTEGFRSDNKEYYLYDAVVLDIRSGGGPLQIRALLNFINQETALVRRPYTFGRESMPRPEVIISWAGGLDKSIFKDLHHVEIIEL